MITGARLERKGRLLLGRLILRYRHFRYRRKQKRGEPITFEVTNGMTLSLLPEGQIPEYVHVGDFESRDLRRVSSILRPGMRIVDVGANVGIYSLLAAKAVGRTGKVWAFEPSSEASRRLVRNCVLNGVERVDVARVALADVEDGVVSLRRDPGYRDGDRYLATRSRPNVTVTAESGDVGDDEAVPVTTLDRYLRTRAEAPAIDFIKIDVEGGEFAVLKGAKDTLKSSHDIVVMFECTPAGCRLAGHEQRDVFQFLSALGLGVYAVDEKTCSWDSREELLKSAGNVWACRDKQLLPDVRRERAS